MTQQTELPAFLTRDVLAGALAHLGLAFRGIHRIEIYPHGILVEHLVAVDGRTVRDPATGLPRTHTAFIPIWDPAEVKRGPT